MSSYYFGGSRSIPLSYPYPIIGKVVSAVLAQGSGVQVGCSAGADQQVIYHALSSSSFSQVRVFAAFAASGAGACSVSAVSAVQSFAARGGSVSWLAGGSLALPLAARLIRRSIAAFQGCAAAVFFVPGRGSLAVAGHAVAAGVPVFAFGQSMPGAPVGCAGQWVASSFMGFPSWLWQSAQLSF